MIEVMDKDGTVTAIVVTKIIMVTKHLKTGKAVIWLPSSHYVCTNEDYDDFLGRLADVDGTLVRHA